MNTFGVDYVAEGETTGLTKKGEEVEHKAKKAKENQGSYTNRNKSWDAWVVQLSV